MADDVLHGAPQAAMLLTGQDRAALDEHGRAAEQRAVGRERGARVGRDGGERRRLDAAKAEVLAPDALVAGRLAGRGRELEAVESQVAEIASAAAGWRKKDAAAIAARITEQVYGALALEVL